MQSWRSPFPFQRGTTRPLFQSVGMMPVFQAELRTACNHMSTAFPPSLRSSTWMPQIPGALPHFNRFTAVCVSTNKGGSQLIRRSAKGTVTPPDIQLSSWLISRVQPLKVTGPAGLHFGLLCQEPTTLHSNCSSPRDGLCGTLCANSPVSRMRIT